MKATGIVSLLLVSLTLILSPPVFAHDHGGGNAGNAAGNTSMGASGNAGDSSQTIAVDYQQPPTIGNEGFTPERTEKHKKRTTKTIWSAVGFMQDNAIFKDKKRKKKKPISPEKKKELDAKMDTLVRDLKAYRDLLLLDAPGTTSEQKKAHVMNNKVMQKVRLFYFTLKRN